MFGFVGEYFVYAGYIWFDFRLNYTHLQLTLE